VSAPSQATSSRAAVLIVDRHPVVRGVVRTACEHSPLLTMVGEAADAEEALEQARLRRPDVVVLDPDGAGGFELARTLREAVPGVRVLVLTARADGDTVLRGMRAGVDGVVSKGAGVREIAVAIETVALGGRVFDTKQQEAALAQLGRMARLARLTSARDATLTTRESAVLDLLAEGLTIRQSATRLHVSPRTVESHVTKLYRKLGVRTRVQALGRAASLGLIDVTRPGGLAVRRPDCPFSCI
jgi:two-component system, NarL family, response regulator DevR